MRSSSRRAAEPPDCVNQRWGTAISGVFSFWFSGTAGEGDEGDFNSPERWRRTRQTRPQQFIRPSDRKKSCWHEETIEVAADSHRRHQPPLPNSSVVRSESRGRGTRILKLPLEATPTTRL